MEQLKDIVHPKSYEYIIYNYPSLRQLCNATVKELISIPYVGKVKAKQLKGILELSQQLLIPEKLEKITTPEDVFNLFKIMGLYEEEQMVGIYLNTKNHIIDSCIISKGTVNASIVHPREIFSPSIRMKSSSVIVVHNHPSGNPAPSPEDTSITKRLIEAGKIIGINLIDHIIIAGNTYYSFKENGLI